MTFLLLNMCMHVCMVCMECMYVCVYVMPFMLCDGFVYVSVTFVFIDFYNAQQVVLTCSLQLVVVFSCTSLVTYETHLLLLAFVCLLLQ